MKNRDNTFAKRQREIEQRERTKERAQKRADRKNRKAEGANGAEGEDPDIAGIVPGPQPAPEE